MSIYEKIKSSAYQPKSEYPSYSEEQPERRRKKQAYAKEQQDLQYQFYLDLCKHSGVSPTGWSKKIFDRAWEHSHSSGHAEIVVYFEELLEFVDSLEKLKEENT